MTRLGLSGEIASHGSSAKIPENFVVVLTNLRAENLGNIVLSRNAINLISNFFGLPVVALDYGPKSLIRSRVVTDSKQIARLVKLSKRSDVDLSSFFQNPSTPTVASSGNTRQRESVVVSSLTTWSMSLAKALLKSRVATPLRKSLFWIERGRERRSTSRRFALLRRASFVVYIPAGELLSAHATLRRSVDLAFLIESGIQFGVANFSLNPPREHHTSLRSLFAEASFLLPRDEVTAETLKSWGLETKIDICPDWVFLSSSLRKNTSSVERNSGVTETVVFPCFTGEDSRREWARIVDAFIVEERTVRIASTSPKIDEPIMDALGLEFPNKLQLFAEVLSQSGFSDLIQRAEHVVSSRFHPACLALLSGTPVSLINSVGSKCTAGLATATRSLDLPTVGARTANGTAPDSLTLTADQMKSVRSDILSTVTNSLNMLGNSSRHFSEYTEIVIYSGIDRRCSAYDWTGQSGSKSRFYRPTD